MATVSKTITIRDQTYHYEECNAYQRAIYRMIDRQLGFIKEKESKYRLNQTQENYNDIQRAVGVLEYLLGKMKAYEGVKEVAHMF